MDRTGGKDVTKRVVLEESASWENGFDDFLMDNFLVFFQDFLADGKKMAASVV